MAGDGEPNVHDLIEQIAQQKEALQKLENLPALVEQLLGKSVIQGLPITVSEVNSQNGDNSACQSIKSTSDDESGLKNLLAGAGNDDDELNKEDGEIEEEISSILEDVEKGVEYGPPLTDTVATSFVKTVMRPLKKDTVTNLKNNLKIPNNCKQFLAPKMNPEIWRGMPSHARVEDLRKQQLQSIMSTSLSALASIADIITKNCKVIPATVKTEILKTSIDAANLLGDQFQEVNSKRRKDVRKYISSQCSSICSKEFGPSEYLFGNDLDGSLRASKNESQLLRRTELQGHRYSPYGNMRKSSQLSGANSLNSNRSPHFLPRRGAFSNIRGGGTSHHSRYFPQNQQQFPRRPN